VLARYQSTAIMPGTPGAIMTTAFAELWESLLPVGRYGPTGGYRRYSFTETDVACHQWFRKTAAKRGLRADHDRNGNLWAWWDRDPGSRPQTQGAIVTGSHLDSVPDGGAFDGPLGVVSAFAALDLLRARGRSPRRPVAVAVFAEEEGARFGVACLGSRLLTGAITPAAARDLADGSGVGLAEAMTGAGLDPDAIGPDEDRLGGIAAYVELHIEQGSALAGLDAAVGLAEGIWPHGRWRIEFTGRADHAGTTRLADRRDPMLPFAATVLAARQAAADHDALATVGKVIAEPGGANAICSAVRCWLDARAPDTATLERVTTQVTVAAQEAAAGHQVSVSVTRESVTPPVRFDAGLRDRLAGALAARGITAPVLPTGAGHDAGVLAARLPTAMLFVRNPAGVSHSPAEHADPADCEAGVMALAAVLEELAFQ
jgi:N-carbamoyl-L-amino-acid hydrolase